MSESAFEALARDALLEVTDARSVGPLVSEVDEGDGVVSLRFESNLPGYLGWKWTVSVAKIGDAEPTVLESELMPGPGALLAPEWVPWSERLEEYNAARAAAEAAGEEDELGDDEEDLVDEEDLLDDEEYDDDVDVDAALDESDEGDEDEDPDPDAVIFGDDYTEEPPSDAAAVGVEQAEQAEDDAGDAGPEPAGGVDAEQGSGAEQQGDERG